MNKLPKVRTADLVIQKLCNRVLIYDRSVDVLHTLDEVSTIVFQACEAQIGFAELKADKKLGDNAIFAALEALGKKICLKKNRIFIAIPANFASIAGSVFFNG